MAALAQAVLSVGMAALVELGAQAALARVAARAARAAPRVLVFQMIRGQPLMAVLEQVVSPVLEAESVPLEMVPVGEAEAPGTAVRFSWRAAVL